MNAKTQEAVEKHGRLLLALFPEARERDPVALCKKLRRVENAAGRVALDWCNGTNDYDEDGFHRRIDALTARANDLLGTDRVWVNTDPRGYALKVDMRDGEELHRDFGGYGIIEPDLTA